MLYTFRMKVVLTGTHFTPAQAVIEELQKIDLLDSSPTGSGISLIYIGRNTTMEGDDTPSVESSVLPKLGVKFLAISAGRLQRQLSLYTIPSLIKIPIGFIQSFFYLLKEMPDLVISFGGYVGLPVVISAWILNIPIIIHEQALVPGLSNSISALFADKIAVSFEEESSTSRNHKTIVTGNPIREQALIPREQPSEFFGQVLAKKNQAHLPLLLVTGGNQGSHFINNLIKDNLKEILKLAVVLHQTGDSKFLDFEQLDIEKKNMDKGDRYFITRWLDPADFAQGLMNADLSISRAGINTLIEASRFNTPTLVIPIDNREQKFNGKYFKDRGLVEVLEQKQATSKHFLAEVTKLLKESAKLKTTLKKTDFKIIPDGAKKLTQEILIEFEKNG